MRLVDLPVPDSEVARAARRVAGEVYSPALLNHSIRSYVWAAAWGSSLGAEIDHELLYVSSMLHDVGLVPEFDNHLIAFEQAGGQIASVLGAGAGWTKTRRDHAARVIVDHMADEPAASDVESHLLWWSTGYEISGLRLDVPDRLRDEVLETYPRFGLAVEFAERLADQAARKTTSAAALAVRDGVVARILNNQLDQL